MSRHHAPATPAEMDTLATIGLTVEGPGFDAYRLQHGAAADAEAGRLIADARAAMRPADSWRRDRGDDGTEDER